MRFHIDRFMKTGGIFIIHGWSESFFPGNKLILCSGKTQLETITKPVTRADLPPLFGDGSEHWGFRAYGIEHSDGCLSTTISLNFPNGSIIDELTTACVPADDHHAHMVWAKFVADVNLKGGRLLEIGSRARSGSTRKSQFAENVKYIGVDISEGENVDIVADAHSLSNFIEEKVDYVCSVSTFEHFILPWKVSLEINKIMVKGGRVFTHSHQTWPEHDVPFDYFRFSEQAWAGLFNAHTGFRIIETKVGHAVSVSALYNVGGPFEEMDRSPGHAMSVCLAEKVSEPLVAWDAPASLIYNASYTY